MWYIRHKCPRVAILAGLAGGELPVALEVMRLSPTTGVIVWTERYRHEMEMPMFDVGVLLYQPLGAILELPEIRVRGVISACVAVAVRSRRRSCRRLDAV